MTEVDDPPKLLRPINRFITTHNPSGEAIFSSAIEERAPVQVLPGDAHFSLAYTSSAFPVRFAGEADITSYTEYLANPPGITISGGTVCRVVDMLPGASSPMHRTVSLDYGVVLEGEVELVLDSGETRLMKRGDVSVQRGTNHLWKNVTDPAENGGWARMLFVLVPAEAVEVEGGVKLEEDTGSIPVRKSD